MQNQLPNGNQEKKQDQAKKELNHEKRTVKKELDKEEILDVFFIGVIEVSDSEPIQAS